MILIILGTQDKKFYRLLDAVEKQIKNGKIKDKVVVQAGHSSDYKSDNMEILDIIPMDRFKELINECDLIITHAGVGSIIDSLRNNKKIIVAPRLEKYKEHTNDHQLQITKKMVEMGYALELDDFNKLDKILEKSKTFQPKKLISNNNKMIKIIKDFIEKNEVDKQ